MFRGVNAINMDAKGRFAMPTKYRERLSGVCEGQMIATIDTQESCLLLYPLPEWEVIEKELDDLSSLNPSHRRLKFLLMGHATEVEVDGNGRILISQPLREYAKLQKKVVLLGQGKRFELWDDQQYANRRESLLGDTEGLEELSDELMSLSL